MKMSLLQTGLRRPPSPEKAESPVVEFAEEDEEEEEAATFLQENMEIESDREDELLASFERGIAQLQQRMEVIGQRLAGEEPEVGMAKNVALLSISSASDLYESVEDMEEHIKRLSMEIDGRDPTEGLCVWTKRPGKYSSGYAGGDAGELDLQGAKDKCSKLGPRVCKAVTCRTSGTCTVRSSPFLSRSPFNETSYMPTASCLVSGSSNIDSKAWTKPWAFLSLPCDWLQSYWSDLFVNRSAFAWRQLAVFTSCFVGAVVAGIQVKQHRWAGDMCGGRTPAPIPGFVVCSICMFIASTTCHPSVPWLLLFVTVLLAYILPPKYTSHIR